jgi:hypothetical protein
VVFLQTVFAGLRRLVLGQTTSEIDAKCGDHFLHADLSFPNPRFADNTSSGFAIGKTLRRFLDVVRFPAGTTSLRDSVYARIASKVTYVSTTS